ncbi:helix-turn-helix transcriptional regulator [Enterococcus faecalis]|nr:helix-turn-helix transcriptional regulator [Enterococcus faecalis]
MMIKKLIEEKKKDKDFAEAYDREGRKLETAVALYHAREEAGLTQAELAQKAHTTQSRGHWNIRTENSGSET